MSRKKTKRLALYKAFENCFDSSATWKGRWQEFFQNAHPIILELGCGKADLSYGLAKMHLAKNYVGIDLKPDRMWAAATKALDEGMQNIALLYIHLLNITEHFAENEVDEVWITFPDPYPKNRHAKHRMINPSFLKLYQNILKPDGLVKYKTDNLDLFLYSLEIFVRQKNITILELTFDLHESPELNEENSITTAFERRFLEQGKKINYVCFKFNE